MTQMFDEKGNRVSLTLVEAGPCVVTQVKTKDMDKYEAMQIGFVPKTKRIKKTEKGKEFRYLKEVRSAKPEDLKNYKMGDTIDVSVFEQGDIVRISGISSGKGFQGVVKRWGFHGRPSTHGTKHEQRTPGSTGGSTPSMVKKGRKMPGRAGFQRKTIKNLKIMKIDKEHNLIALNGASPGRKGTLLEIRG